MGSRSVALSLDAVSKEDKWTVCKDNGAQNLLVLKRIALNILKADKTRKKATGLQKRLRDAGNRSIWNLSFETCDNDLQMPFWFYPAFHAEPL